MTEYVAVKTIVVARLDSYWIVQDTQNPELHIYFIPYTFNCHNQIIA